MPGDALDPRRAQRTPSGRPVEVILDLAPRDVLALAIGIEQANAHSYREWAHRFRPYDRAASALLDELAGEEREHARELSALYRAEYGTEPEPLDPADAGVRVGSAADAAGRHFFVVDVAAARHVLESALAAEQRTRDFYVRVLEHPAMRETGRAGLREVCERLAAFEEAHVAAIRARMDAPPRSPE